MMIGTRLLARIRLQTSDPSMRGSMRSRITRSGSLSAFSRPCKAVARDVDLVAFVLEFELQNAADGGVVFDDEDL